MVRPVRAAHACRGARRDDAQGEDRADGRGAARCDALAQASVDRRRVPRAPPRDLRHARNGRAGELTMSSDRTFYPGNWIHSFPTHFQWSNATLIVKGMAPW